MKKLLYTFLKKNGYFFENVAKKEQTNRRFLAAVYSGKKHELLVRSIHFIKNLLHTYPELTIKDHKEGYLFSFYELQLYVETYEELFILSEVYFKRDYNITLKPNTILIDIGANIGCTSLYFSKQTEISKIYAFEPVPATFQQATDNIHRNGMQDRIVLVNSGLGDSDREETFMFNAGVKGNTGVRGAQSTSYNEDKVVPVVVQIENATSQINQIIKNHPTQDIIIKMDCEGGEYEIIKNITTSGVLTKVKAIAMEWHDQGSSVLLTQLTNNHFICFHPHLAINSGMIYAVNTAL